MGKINYLKYLFLGYLNILLYFSCHFVIDRQEITDFKQLTFDSNKNIVFN